MATPRAFELEVKLKAAGNQEFNSSQLRSSIPGRFELDGERYGILVRYGGFEEKHPAGGDGVKPNANMVYLVMRETAPLDANNMPGQGDLPCRFEQFQGHRSGGSEIRLAARRNQSSGQGDPEQASGVCRLFHAQFATAYKSGYGSLLSAHASQGLAFALARLPDIDIYTHRNCAVVL